VANPESESTFLANERNDILISNSKSQSHLPRFGACHIQSDVKFFFF